MVFQERFCVHPSEHSVYLVQKVLVTFTKNLEIKIFVYVFI